MPRLSSGAVLAKAANVPASPVEEGLELMGHTTFTSRRRCFRPAPRSTATSGRAPGEKDSDSKLSMRIFLPVCACAAARASMRATPLCRCEWLWYVSSVSPKASTAMPPSASLEVMP